MTLGIPDNLEVEREWNINVDNEHDNNIEFLECDVMERKSNKNKVGEV